MDSMVVASRIACMVTKALMLGLPSLSGLPAPPTVPVGPLPLAMPPMQVPPEPTDPDPMVVLVVLFVPVPPVMPR